MGGQGFARVELVKASIQTRPTSARPCIRVWFLLREFLCCLRCLCVVGFIGGNYFVIICSSSLLLLVPHEGCALYFWHFLGTFTYGFIFDIFQCTTYFKAESSKPDLWVFVWHGKICLLGCASKFALCGLSMYGLFFIFKPPNITKTRLFKYIENFTSKNWKFSGKKLWYFSHICLKHRLWVLVRTASARRF